MCVFDVLHVICGAHGGARDAMDEDGGVIYSLIAEVTCWIHRCVHIRLEVGNCSYHMGRGLIPPINTHITIHATHRMPLCHMGAPFTLVVECYFFARVDLNIDVRQMNGGI